MKTLLPFLLLLFFAGQLPAQENDSNTLKSRPLFVPQEKTIFYKLGDHTVPLHLEQYGSPFTPYCINLHANEFTSVVAVQTVLEETGGALLRIENNRQRVIWFRFRGVRYGIDPNRIFSQQGIEKTLRDNGRYHPDAAAEVEKFAQRILDLVPEESDCIVALHNNTEEAFSVRSYLPGNTKEQDARRVYADSLQDADDLVFTTDSMLYQRMADAGYNSIWQDNLRAEKDGSLSVYFGEKKRRYINIETQHGKTEQYRKMFRQLCNILAEEGRPEKNDREREDPPKLLINN